MANAKEEAGECSAATYIRSLNATEACRRLFQNIRHMEGKTRAGATSQIKITNADGTSTDITGPSKMNAALLTNNEKLYHQTEGVSEFLLPENVKLFGNYGEGPAIDSILDGTFAFPEGLSDSTVDFLKSCKRDMCADQTPPPSILHRGYSYTLSELLDILEHQKRKDQHVQRTYWSL